ncbi:MAG: metallopeptidase family protein [Nitriliruptoraceae bacterium]
MARCDRHGRRRRTPVDGSRRPFDGYRARSGTSFERVVAAAMASLPDEVITELDNLHIAVAEVPPEDVSDSDNGVLLGLYEGVPRTDRDFDAPLLPDQITIFRRPLEIRSRSRAELADNVRDTGVHDIAHHFGIDDDRLDDLGWA